MANGIRFAALDRQRATARRYRARHRGEAGNLRVLAAASIEARAGHRMLREMLTAIDLA